MRGHAGFPCPAHSVAFLGLGEDDSRPALRRLRRGERRVELAQVVAAAPELVDVAIGHVRDELAHLRIAVEKIGEIISAVLGAERLVLTVDRLGETTQKMVIGVTREDHVPLGTPQDLDYVPACACKQAFELHHDLPVAAHRAIEALEIAVDDEGEIVQLLARGERKRSDGLRLVHLPVAEDAPDAPAVAIDKAAIAKVSHEPRLIDRANRADAHRTRWKLPEIRHQPGMWIRREAVPGELLSIEGEICLVEAPFEEGARVDAWRRMGLKEHEVAAVPDSVTLEEMIEAGLEDLRHRRIARDVAAELAVGAVGSHDHRERIPADDCDDPLLEHEIPRKGLLVLKLDRIAIGRIGMRARGNADLHRALIERLEQKPCPSNAMIARNRFERGDPFGRFVRIGVVWSAGVSGLEDGSFVHFRSSCQFTLTRVCFTLVPAMRAVRRAHGVASSGRRSAKIRRSQ
jgi:hypothetical protein